MQKLLFFFLFNLFLVSNASAQNWFSAEYRWVFHVSGGFAGINQDFEMYAASDTVIQGHASRKWVFHTSGFFSMDPKFTYSDGLRAYNYVAALDSFVKIYDFSLPVGSKVVIPNEVGAFFTYQIDTIDVVQAGNLTLKRQRVHFIEQNGQPTDWKFDILENAGMVGRPFDDNYPTCSFVLIPDFQCGSIADGYDITFLCFSTPTGSFNPFSGTCSVVGATEPGNNSFLIAPNPATDYFDIQTNNNSPAIQAVSLTDVSGKKMREWKSSQPQYSIQNLPTGIYFVEIVFENGTRASQKLHKR